MGIKNFFRKGVKYSVDDIEKFAKLFGDKADRRRRNSSPLNDYREIKNLLQEEMQDFEPVAADAPKDALTSLAESFLTGYMNKKNSNSITQVSPPVQSPPQINSERVSLALGMLKPKIPQKALPMIKGLSDDEILAIVRNL